MGLQDGWHGDEYECRGSCGLCDECEARAEKKADMEFESDRDN